MTLKVFLVLIFGFVAVFGLPQFRRHHDHDHDHDHHDRHHHEFDHHHDIHHGGQHYGGHHHSDHHDHRFRRSSRQETLNGLRKARHHSGGFDAPYESFGEHGNYQGYKLHGQRRPLHGKKTEFSSSSAIAKSISTPYGSRMISKTRAHSVGTIVSKD